MQLEGLKNEPPVAVDTRVIKRTGDIVDYDIEKIRYAIERGLNSVEAGGPASTATLALLFALWASRS
jgi:hypothetical protein